MKCIQVHKIIEVQSFIYYVCIFCVWALGVCFWEICVVYGQLVFNNWFFSRFWVDRFSLNLCFIFTFLLFYSLDNHLVVCHKYPKDEFSCDTCKKGFSYRPSLLKHRALQHGDIRKYPCENCTKVSDLSWFLLFYSFVCMCGLGMEKHIIRTN